MKRFRWIGYTLCLAMLLVGCDHQTTIVTGVPEKEANVILVLLKSRGIDAEKLQASSLGAGNEGPPKFSVSVSEANRIDAIAILNQNGFPKPTSTTLLDLYSKTGLTTSDREERIRYQAGLESQIAGMIMMMDGVIDASVQLSFPPEESVGTENTGAPNEITAAVYVKHQSLIDDPNMHLENKVKRLVSGSVTGLKLNNVTVVSDRSRFTDINIDESAESLGGTVGGLVEIWSIGIANDSKGRFRLIFFLLMFFLLVFAIIAGWLAWKVYPVLKKGGVRELLSPKPIEALTSHDERTLPPAEGR